MLNVTEYLLKLQKLIFFEQLKSILYNLDVNYVVLKGDILSMQAYGKINVRNYSDIDILIPKHSIFCPV